MNRRLLPIIAALLVLLIVLGTTPFTDALAAEATVGPKLEVWTIAQDDQFHEKGVMILGLVSDETEDPVSKCDPTGESETLPACVDAPRDLMSQHKILVAYNGAPIMWRVGDAGPVVVCNIVEKDKVFVVPDPKTGQGQQFETEVLMTKLFDVSDQFACKARWKSPDGGAHYESTGVLDVYFTGMLDAHYLADYMLVVEVTYLIGRTIVWGTEMQDVCVLGWWGEDTSLGYGDRIEKADGTWHYIFDDPINSYASCGDLALIQRDAVGVKPQIAQDPEAMD
jgi:hypothetical protein